MTLLDARFLWLHRLFGTPYGQRHRTSLYLRTLLALYKLYYYYYYYYERDDAAVLHISSGVVQRRQYYVAGNVCSKNESCSLG